MGVARDWRALAEQCEYERAFELMRSGEPVLDEPYDLLLAARTARAAGDPEVAIECCERFLRDHPAASDAGVAASMLGRLLTASGDHERAAAAFAKARSLAPDGWFAQLAMIREIEARAASGDRGTAAKLGRAFLSMYPDGHLAATARDFAGE